MIPNDNIDHHILAEERRAILLRELNDTGYIQAAELAERLNISAITIRRDLTQLEEEGLCVRKRDQFGNGRRSDRGGDDQQPFRIHQVRDRREIL